LGEESHEPYGSIHPTRFREESMRLHSRCLVLAIVVLAAHFVGHNSCNAADRGGRENPFKVRPFVTESDDRWVGNAICYGPHRDGQRPGGAAPSAAELREDLDLMLPHWNLLRIYGSSEFSETLLSLIRDDKLDMKVVLGVWIAPEERRDESGVVVERFPDAVSGNQREIDAAIRLAKNFPDIVIAVSVGNETQIFWSAHRSPLDILIHYVRRVRAGVDVPVTVADDFNFWNKPESRTLAAEVDFIMMHAHPMWNGLQLEDALTWLQEQIGVVQKMHPDRPVVLGETGWATSVHTEGEQAELIKGKPGEDEQRFFYEAVRKWADSERFPVFFFEAFDENWKGGPNPAEVEKHWGLFNADRSPKAAMADTDEE
jgi:exo-beta-1,3-glucanase (GH17 family)